MIAKYIRISDKSQKIDRQVNDTDKLYIDIISSKTKFSERPLAKQLVKDIEAGLITQVTVQEVSRLGRSLIDILQTLQYMTSKGVNVYVHNIGMYSLIDGKESPAFTMVVTILANIAQQEIATLRERQAEGIAKALERGGVYKGRLKGSGMTNEEVVKKHPDIVRILKSNKKGTTKISLRNIAKITQKNTSTVVRVSKAFTAINAPLYYNAALDPFATSNTAIAAR